MELELFTVCDYSEELSGKLVIIGTFDTIWANSFPATHPTFSVAARFLFSENELGNHIFKLFFRDENNFDFFKSIEGKINVPKPSYGQYTAIQLTLNLGNIKFESAGKYYIELYFDDELKRKQIIYLREKQL